MDNTITDTLFTPTPRGLTDAQCLRRYLAASAVARVLKEPIEAHLRDWSPVHIDRFKDMATARSLGDRSHG